MTISDFYYKKLGKMIDNPDYDLNERYAPKLLDAGYIEFKRQSVMQNGYYMFFSFYIITQLGKIAYKEWKNNADI